MESSSEVGGTSGASGLMQARSGDTIAAILDASSARKKKGWRADELGVDKGTIEFVQALPKGPRVGPHRGRERRGTVCDRFTRSSNNNQPGASTEGLTTHDDDSQ